MLDQSPLDLAFRALGDPTRRAMMERLSQGPLPVGELARPLDMSLQAVMQHLAVLEGSGLVRSHKQGRVRTCRIEPQALSRMEGWLAGRRTELEQQLDRISAYVEVLKRKGNPDVDQT